MCFLNLGQANHLDLGVQLVLLRKGYKFCELVPGAPHRRHESGFMRYRSKAEGNRSAIQAHHYSDSLARNVIASSGEGGICPHKVDHRSEQAIHLAGSNSRVGSQTQSLLPLFR